jgi:hypothetical protein
MLHPNADFERMIASAVRLAIFDARQGSRPAKRFLHDAGLAERAGIMDGPPLLTLDDDACDPAAAELAQDKLPAGKKSTVWEQGHVQVISVVGKVCCYGVVVADEVKHVVPASRQWRLEKAAAIALAQALAA